VRRSLLKHKDPFNGCDAIHSPAIEQGLEIAYSMRTEEWGVRRFFVRDPNGVVINVMTHNVIDFDGHVRFIRSILPKAIVI